ncbi:hypothetical protein EDB83DRAFT_800069 [Lactarius deliciosus]|nr:hypothetical protein EDB83DRAFT_800069 [Lactarius deliciosus]
MASLESGINSLIGPGRPSSILTELLDACSPAPLLPHPLEERGQYSYSQLIGGSASDSMSPRNPQWLSNYHQFPRPIGYRKLDLQIEPEKSEVLLFWKPHIPPTKIALPDPTADSYYVVPATNTIIYLVFINHEPEWVQHVDIIVQTSAGIPQVFATTQKTRSEAYGCCGIPANRTPTPSINIPDAHLVGMLSTSLMYYRSPSVRSQTYTAQRTPADSSLRGFNQLPLGPNRFARSHRMMTRSSSPGPIHHVPKAPRRHLTNELADGTLNPTHLSPTTSPLQPPQTVTCG